MSTITQQFPPYSASIAVLEVLTLLLPQWKVQVVSCLPKGYCARIHRLECTVRCYRPSHLMGSCHTHWKWTQLKEALFMSALPHCQQILRYGFTREPDSCSELTISTEQISSWETNSSSRHSPNSLELENSSPCSQGLSSRPYSDSDQFSPRLPIFFLKGPF